MTENIISLKGIKKSFGGVHALKNVDLVIKEGETHCLAGENGCGKSTIIKIISGFYKADEGEIIINGKKMDNFTPVEAIKAGIQVIYQDFSIFPNLTVLENLAFNQVLSEKRKLVNKKKFREIAQKAVEKINFNVDLDVLVETLPVADKQLIAISRALLDNAKLIIMDEPTTALTKKEVNRLFEIVSDLKKNGVTILFVSHKLDEVFEISDKITVLRSGENVVSCPIEEMTEEKFVFAMTGRNFDSQIKKEKPRLGEVVLKVENLTAPGFKDVNFSLRQGEILGISGQLGSGRTELSLALFGLLKPESGLIKIDGNQTKIESVTDAIKNRIALVPEDRLTEGLFLPQSIMKNITVSRLDELANLAGVINNNNMINESQSWVDSIGVATKNHMLPVQTLSGGNQQKVVLARWLATNPRILILNGPTVGVDIGAKYDIHNLIKKLAKGGMAVIVVSDDAAEVIATCDRVLVMQKGKITNELIDENLNAAALANSAL